MEGFRQNPKMKSQIACFKEGGSTTPAKKEAKSHMKADVAEDKKIVKKAVAQHEGAKHKGEEKTELKLKQGGRAKKDKPSVKRFDSKAIKMKKDDSDKKAIAKVKKTKPVVESMSPAPEAPAPEGMGMGMEDTQDMGVEGYADGRTVGDMSAYLPEDAMNAVSNASQMAGQMQAANRGRMRPTPALVGQGAMTDAARAAAGMAGGMGNMGQGMMDGVGNMGQGIMGGMGNLGRGIMGGQGGISDRERAILQGLQAVGNYCGGGKAY